MNFTVLCICLVMAVVVTAAPPKFTNRYDHLDIDGILGNARTLNSYISCLLDNGPCTAEGRELKAHIPEALESSCEQCTDSQKKFLRKGTKYLIAKKPEEWKKISSKYDPEDKYKEFLQKFLTEE